jgi:hypothetical protein
MIVQWGNVINIAIGRRNLLVQLDRNVRAAWTSIRDAEGILVWGGDLRSRLKEYQLFRGEHPRLRLVNPVDMTVPLPRDRFVPQFGFDPYSDTALMPGRVRVPPVGDPAYEAFFQAFAHRLHQATRQRVLLLAPGSDSVLVVEDPPQSASPTPRLPSSHDRVSASRD